MIPINQIIELAKEIEAGDPIDWGNLPLSRELTYNIMANAVLDRISESKTDEEREIILMATCVKLVVENFVLELHQQLLDK